MANRTEHMETGSLAGAIIYLLAMKAQKQTPELGGVVASAIGGAIVSILPDKFDPPVNCNHRRTAHSWSAAASIAHFGKQAWDNPKIESKQKAFIVAMIGACLSHHALDSETPAGLPLI